jgi:hypothetical protein
MNPWSLAALAAQRQEELHQAALGARRGPPRSWLRRHLSIRHRFRHSMGWALVEVGLKLAVDHTVVSKTESGSGTRQAA